VPLVRHSSAVPVDVQSVPVAPAQPKDDAMPWEARVEAWTLELHVAWVESWVTRGVRPKLRAPCWAWQKSAKQVTKEPCRGGQSDRPV
jgi:hypothetical protein